MVDVSKNHVFPRLVSFHCLGDFFPLNHDYKRKGDWFWLGYSGIFNSCNPAGSNWWKPLFGKHAGSELNR